MMDGLEHVAAAAVCLATASSPLAPRLDEAMHDLRKSLARPEEWPEDLWRLAVELDREYTQHKLAPAQPLRVREVARNLLTLSDSVMNAVHERAKQRIYQEDAVAGEVRTAPQRGVCEVSA